MRRSFITSPFLKNKEIKYGIQRSILIRRPEESGGRNGIEEEIVGKEEVKKETKEVMRKRDSPENYQQSQAS